MKEKNFVTEIHKDRKKFISANKTKDHVLLAGENHVLLSAPHGVKQTRLGKPKVAEIGSLALVLRLHKDTNSFFIAKTKNNFDDANFDEHSPYKYDVAKCVRENDIKYFVDIHGLAAHRKCDVNLGVHLGLNTEVDEPALNELVDLLKHENLIVWIDKPFMASTRTLSGGAKKAFPHLWTIQIEINCSITNNVENADKCKRLYEALKQWIKNRK